MDEPQWEVLDLPPGIDVEHLSDSSPGYVVISGLRDGTAFAAEVNADGELIVIPIAEEAAAHGSARTVRSSDRGVLGVCGTATLWGRRRDDEGLDDNAGWEEYVATPTQVYELPRDETGAEAVWLWVTAGDGELQATAAYPKPVGHELRPLDIDTHRLMGVDQRLVTAAPLADLHVAAFGGRVTVAGPITDPDTLTSWWAPCYDVVEEETRDPLPWNYNPFEDPPARLLGCIDWLAQSFYVGVTAEGTVALWDAEGELRETTDLHVDPDHPVAVIAELDGWGSWGEREEPGGLAAFVVGTPEGNVLSYAGVNYSMPTGVVRGAVVNRGYDLIRCFALIDDDVHVIGLWDPQTG